MRQGNGRIPLSRGAQRATLYHPVWTRAIKAPGDVALALVTFALLGLWNIPAWLVVVIAALGGTVLGALCVARRSGVTSSQRQI